MARFLILLALCVLLPALVSASGRSLVEEKYTVIGRVYCDICGLGYENAKSTYIEGAEVKIECKYNGKPTFTSKVAKTDKDGNYEIEVKRNCKEELCHAVLVSSPQKDCNKIQEGREKATVILTDNNGIRSSKRYANNLGCVKEHAITTNGYSESGCAELAALYKQEDV